MDIKELQKELIEFRDAIDWEHHPNPKNLAISLSLGARGCAFSAHFLRFGLCKQLSRGLGTYLILSFKEFLLSVKHVT